MDVHDPPLEASMSMLLLFRACRIVCSSLKMERLEEVEDSDSAVSVRMGSVVFARTRQTLFNSRGGGPALRFAMQVGLRAIRIRVECDGTG